MGRYGYVLTYDNKPFSFVTVASLLKEKNGNEYNNGRREFTLIWMPGALLLPVVYQHSPWIHKQFYRAEKKWFSQRLFMWRQSTQAMDKGSFHVQYSDFQTQRFFMLDKYILKVKLHPI